MGRYLTLAACQMGPIPKHASRRETVERLVCMLENAAKAGAELVVFPEMGLTTFFPRWLIEDDLEIESYFESSFPSSDTEPLFAAARKLRLGFALGYCERADEGNEKRRFNTMSLVSAEGEIIGRYRKIHVPGTETVEPGFTPHLERRYFLPGDLGFPVFSYRGIGIGLAICNDRRWPETYRMLALNGADIVLLGYNTPFFLEEAPEMAHLRMFHNHLPMQAGAYQNALWVAAAAKAGVEEGQFLIGGSCIIAPSGEMAALAQSLGDEMIVHRADLDFVQLCRKANFDFDRYRRPDQYRSIGERRAALARPI
ncbi:MAG: N-carbamoyl-D-amino-acid hydrolase [Hyphomicrobiales bacterium]|nr:N-carbamoyl-D-amino-acid hydrolase [Hyphomicrobiales bacterium]